MRSLPLIATVVALGFAAGSYACCALGRLNQPIVNADQTVLMVWNPETRTQHFIRKANFWTSGKDFGFVVPSPSYPQLAESGEGAFGYLNQVTAPAVRRIPKRREYSTFFDVKANIAGAAPGSVRVLHEQDVAGFRATVLEADDAGALRKWLKDNDFPISEAFTKWAEPYIRQQWKFTALKLSKDKAEADGAAAKSLRISFNTETPIFPYREPESEGDALKLNVSQRLLRLYFLADTQYEGRLGSTTFETNPVWSGRLSDPQRQELTKMLGLDSSALPTNAWLTEFEHRWPYKLASADVEFRAVPSPQNWRRPDVVEYYDVDDLTYFLGDYALLKAAVGIGLAAVVALLIARRLWSRRAPKAA